MIYSGSSGVRIKWGNELMRTVQNVGNAMPDKYPRIVVGSDFRITSDAIAHLLISSLLSRGAEVTYGGHVPTPTLAFAARHYDAGVMITASHNPPEYNGLKFWNPDGTAFSEGQIDDLRALPIAEWSKTGNFRTVELISEHIDAILKSVNGIDLKVVLDCSNGAGSVISPLLIREMGASVVTMNCHTSGYFPGHPSEPNEKNLSLLKKIVVKTHADVGIAHDGDADRMVVVTSSGQFLNGDAILAIFSDIMKFKSIVAPVNSSMLLDHYANVIRCRVGDANVSQVMKSQGVRFGGEQSGTQIFADWRYTPDAIYSAAKFLEIVNRINLNDIVSIFPQFSTIRKSVFYENRREIEQKIIKFVSDYECQNIDGYRCLFSNGWFLIRFSGTEPKVRVTVESENEKDAKTIMEDIIRRLTD